MDSFKRPRGFDPLDLQIIDRVYEAAWAQFVAGGSWRDTSRDVQRQEALRKWLFHFAGPGPVDFDSLYNKVLPHWTTSPSD